MTREDKVRDLICKYIHKLTGKLRCPYCWKDMTIRPGAVMTCDRQICPCWRIAL